MAREIEARSEDASDAELIWVGPRLIGGLPLGSGGLLGYWLDAAWVLGREEVVELEPAGPGRSRVTGVRRRSVRGFGIDIGFTWFLPHAHEPRLTLALALGTGDPSPERGDDRAFRQTGLHGNETSFGGVQRLGSYGELLAPELSNLTILTLGTGISLFRASSLELVYHAYWLRQPAESLRDARLETELDGRHRALGQALDLVLAIEEGPRFEIELSASVFRAGRAWGPRDGEWAVGGLAAFRVAF